MTHCEEEAMRIERHLAQVVAPPNSDAHQESLFEQLRCCTLQWLRDFQDAGFDECAIVGLQERWTEVLAVTLEAVHDADETHAFDQWLETKFLQWGQTDLGEVIAQFEDGEAEFLADNAFAEFATEFSTTTDKARLSFLRQRIRALLEQGPVYPHRLPRTNGRSTAQEQSDQVTMKFEEQSRWHDGLRKIVWDQGIAAKPIPRLLRGSTPHFLVVHLFSGRRRHQDVHYWLAQWAEQRGARITIISMDTAVSQEYGNLQEGTVSWEALEKLYEHGVVSATLAGSPCETFSAARHLPPPVQDSLHRWPRPLRSAARLFGLQCLTRKELRQCRQGTAFALQTLYAAAQHLARGGLFLSEHPACPEDEDKASVWRTALIGLLTQDPDCQLQTFPQWKWGSATPKPTGLFSIRIPYLAKSMYACADPSLPYPTKVAQGLDTDGSFNTAACKEYPPLFCRALAKALTDQFETSLRAKNVIQCTVDDTAVHRWLHEAAQESAVIHEFTTFRPDFQGR